MSLLCKTSILPQIFSRLLIGLIAIQAMHASARAQTGSIDFRRDILPILSENCFHCHGPDAKTREADLRLDTRDGILGKRDDQAAVVVAGKPNASTLLQRMTSPDPDERMPPADSNRKLTAQQIALFKNWIEQGANWAGHWAYERPVHHELPKVKHKGWLKNGIDAFILSRLEREGLSPSAEADKVTLIRRVTLDLTGLPPTPEEVDAFFADQSAGAYEKLVDRLLKSTRYGERMVWDWLDAARYADSNGYQGDPERTMWPWRDWVISAMNSNLPFDQFTIEQLAGDLLPNATLAQKIATGFNRNHMHNGEGGRIPEETRVENVIDRVETTATVWLGVTMTCARCHDHKYDPITQQDYYSLYDFFNNTSEKGNGRSGQNAPAITFTPEADKKRLADLAPQIVKLTVPVVEAEKQLQSKPVAAPKPGQNAVFVSKEVIAALKVPPANRNKDRHQKIYDHFKSTDAKYAALLKPLLDAVAKRESINRSLPRVMVMDTLAKPRETFILEKGAYNKPLGKVSANVPASLIPLPANAVRNRLSLAQWMVSKDNPLPARVTVNKYWQLFFGTGLVTTPEDFGSQGKPPTHPKLLDWLSTEFQNSGWDVKRLHKLIVMSATYRQSSKVTPELIQRDPTNSLLARGPRFRMPSWMLRDQALFVSGLLVEKVGGPSVKPYQPTGVWAEATFGKKKYVQDRGEKLYRRSVYTFWRRIVGPTIFFDVANRQVCSVKVARTNTPLHALATLNDVTYVEASRALAQRVMLETGKSAQQKIERAFRLVTSRKPTAVETKILRSRLKTLKTQFAADTAAATELLKAGESPRDEKLNPIEHAAFTTLCSLILNLDETLTKQ